MAKIKYPFLRSKQPSNLGERRLLSYLETKLPDSYTVIPNCEITGNFGGDIRFGEYDAIIIGPEVAFAIENKNYHGPITGNDQYWILDNGKQIVSPAKLIASKSRVLGGKIKMWVYPIVTLSAQGQTLNGFDQNADYFIFTLDNDELAEYITDSKRAARHPQWNNNAQKDAISVLTDVYTPQSKRTSIEGLKIKKEITPEDVKMYRQYLCYSSVDATKEVIVREYTLDPVDGDQNTYELMKHIATNAKSSASLIGQSRYVQQTQCHFSDGDDFYYEIMDAPNQKDLVLLSDKIKQGALTNDDKVKIIRELSEALVFIHNKEVYHRNIKPENVLVGEENAMLFNFDNSWSRIHERNNFTVPLNQLIANSSPYTPPEFLLDNPAFSERSDEYSLGVLTYYLFTGKQPFKDLSYLRAGNTIALPSKLDCSCPEWIDDVISNTICLDYNNRWTAQQIVDFIESKNIVLSAPQTNLVAQVDSIKELKPGMYVTEEIRLEKELGKGGFSRVFKAWHNSRRCNVAIKIFKSDSNDDSAFNEYKVLEQLDHPNIVKFIDINRTRHGFSSILMPFVKGFDLTRYTASGGARMPLEQVYKMAEDVLCALCYIHGNGKQLLHRDIKPNNIMQLEDDPEKFILIDFNIAGDISKEEDTCTRQYLAPDIVTPDLHLNWDTSADTFALGVTIYQLVTQHLPWGEGKWPTNDTKQIAKMRNWPGCESLSDPFVNFVMKAIDPSRNNRFMTAEEMVNALHVFRPSEMREYKHKDISKKLGDLHLSQNEIVTYINTLYSQSQHGNGGTRANVSTVVSANSVLDELTYVPTRLDKQLLEDILDLKHRLVIITGNAGDGKTAYMRQLEKKSRGRLSFYEPLVSGNGCKFSIIKDGTNRVDFETNYDGSQDEPDKDNEQVLRDFFTPMANREDYSQLREGRIIAINEGRLMDFLNTNSNDYAHLRECVQQSLSLTHTDVTPIPGLIIVDLNKRSVTAPDTDGSLLYKLIQILCAPDFWKECEKCPLRNATANRPGCFIRHNVLSLSDNTSGSMVVERLEKLLRAVTYRHNLHITIRYMRSFISYILTHDMNCNEVRVLLDSIENENDEHKRKLKLLDYLQLYYFNVTSPSDETYKLRKNDLKPSGNEDRLIKVVRNADLAEVSIPSIDSKLYHCSKAPQDYLTFNNKRDNILNLFNSLSDVLPRWVTPQNNVEKSDDSKLYQQILMRSVVRFHYFEAADKNYLRRLPFRYLSAFCEELANLKHNDEAKTKTKELLACAISRSEGCNRKSLFTNHIVISNRQLLKGQQAFSFRRYSLDDFDISVSNIGSLADYIEHEPDSMKFFLKADPTINITVSLDVYELLKYIESGYEPSVNDIKGRLIELQIFKNLLSMRRYTELLVTNDHRTYTRISLTDEMVIKIEKYNG